MPARGPALNKISFHFLVRVSLRQRLELKNFLLYLFKREGVVLDSLSLVFCSDDYLLDINRQYLDHDYYTDIITFVLSPAKAPLVVDIYISIDRVKENAAKFEASVSRELLRVIFHGALHCCGYADHTPKEINLMRKKEEEYLERYYVPRRTVS